MVTEDTMAFRFRCPNGHLLETEPHYGGRPSRCPTCGTFLEIPAAPAAGMAATQPDVFHIPCPNGHRLETPTAMLEQRAKCPHCGIQFRLREKNSEEARQRRQQAEQMRARRLNRAWLNWSIAMGVVVIVALVGLVLFEILGRTVE